MATISGTDNAFHFALANVMRAGASRAGYHSSSVYITVAGTDRTTKARPGSLSIADAIDHEPNTAQILFYNTFTPAIGDSIVIQLGSSNNAERLFGGRILSTRQVYEGEDRQSVVWECGLIDYTWELNQKVVRGRFTNQTAESIIISLVADFAPEFTSGGVDSGLGTIGEITFTEERFSDAMTRIMRRVGGYWKVEYDQVVSAFLSDEINPPLALTDTHASLREPFLEKDNSQIATRITIEGKGTQVLERVAVGQTSIPVDDASPFSSGGGEAKVPHGQILTYTGRALGGGNGSTVSNALASPGALTATDGTNLGRVFGAYLYKVSFADETGETPPGTASSSVTPDKTYEITGLWASTFVTTTNKLYGAVAWSPTLNLFVALSHSSSGNKAIYSSDGISWTEGSSIESNQWRDVVWAPSLALFCAVSLNGTNRVATSTDGITWTARSASDAEPWRSLTWNEDDSLFVAVAFSASAASKAVMTSTDGAAWTRRTAPSAIQWSRVTWADTLSLFVAIASNATTSGAMTSPDGITWLARTTIAGNLDSIAWSNELGLLVALGSASQNYETSTDGIVWTQRTLPSTMTGRFERVVWAPEVSRFMAVATNGTDRAGISSDGTSWTPLTATSATNWRGLAWSPSLLRWVAGGDETSLMYTGAVALGETVALSSIPTGGTPTTKRLLWRTKDGGSVYFFLDELSDNSTTTHTDDKIDSELGRLASSISTLAINDGDTAIRVQLLENFSGSGGWASVSGQVILYTGRSASSGEGTLTGVPASGALGAVRAEIAAGETLLPVGSITGVTATGSGSVVTQLGSGETINIYITRNDGTAQTALATLLGGSADGIFEQFIQDRRLRQTECENRGDAVLTLQKDAVQDFTWGSRDTKTRSGKTITVDLTSPQSIDTTFKIQSVNISEIDTAPSFAANETGLPVSQRMPLYRATASRVFFSFEDLLRRMREGSERIEG